MGRSLSVRRKKTTQSKCTARLYFFLVHFPMNNATPCCIIYQVSGKPEKLVFLDDESREDNRIPEIRQGMNFQSLGWPSHFSHFSPQSMQFILSWLFWPFFFLAFLGPLPGHMEVPRLGVDQAAAAGLHHSTEMWDPNRICNVH